MNLPADDDIRKLRDILDAHAYDGTKLKQRLGVSAPPPPADRDRVLNLTREMTPGNALVRLFLLGASISESAADTLPRDLLDIGLRGGLLELRDGRIRPKVLIVPMGGLLFASDAFDVLGGSRAAEFVLPASTHAAAFLSRLTLRDAVGSTLDLGCGCGVHALLAAAHSSRVVATDISEAAVNYTRFNAVLNGIANVECRVGDLFAPVEGDRFDLIVSNPPFVPGPGGQFVYRDSAMELDSFCSNLVAKLPAFLNEGGIAQVLCESVEIGGESWPDRIRSWVRGTGCDAWVLHTPPVRPANYVARRLADTVLPSGDGGRAYDEWLAYFDARNVTGIHPAVLTLRRRDGQNWAHFHGLAGEVGDNPASAVRAGITACDFLARCADDRQLLAARLRLSPALKLEQRFRREDDDWRPEHSLLWVDNGLRMDAEVDIQVIAFLQQITPAQPLGDVIAAFANVVGADAQKLAADLLPVVRLFVGRGFLEPVEG